MKTADITDKQVCEAARDAHAEKLLTSKLLERRTGYPEKIVCSAIERAIRHKLLDYGVSVRSSYLTPKGEDFLREA